MGMVMKLLVNGAAEFDEVPLLGSIKGQFDVAFAPDGEALAEQLPGAEVLLGWNFRGKELQNSWHLADSLKWIHWCGAGVDAVLFPALSESTVTLTNARGIFDRAMAEYVLAMILSDAKHLRETYRLQERSTWQHRLTDRISGRRVVIVGVGSIGREVARLLKAAGMTVEGVGRSGRPGDEEFDVIHAQSDVTSAIGSADWVVGILPSTAETDGFFSTEFFSAMKPSARFMNLGRGRSLDDEALLDALDRGVIAGAMLDVYSTEPLPEDHAFWSTAGLTVSPHMSGDYVGFEEDVARQFLDNLTRYRQSEPLINVVDKKLGFVRP